MLNKVPEVTLYFWIIKVLCTTVGETFADNLDQKLNLGLTKLGILMSGALIVSLVFQFRARRYVPGLYWLAVVLISVVGTLISDNLTDNYGVTLEATTIAFGIALALVFTAWYAVERSLSIHTIVTARRETFYWLTILFTFALGTSAGDLIAEKSGLGYLNSVFLFAGAIAVVAVAHLRFHMHAIFSFWGAYVLTRPLGASIGDYLSQPHAESGLGLGTTVTSLIFLSTILALVTFLAITKVDQTPDEILQTGIEHEQEHSHGHIVGHGRQREDSHRHMVGHGREREDSHRHIVGHGREHGAPPSNSTIVEGADA
jgi:uncharacterized membrane-anchored protein